jgi:hypothetical protein
LTSVHRMKQVEWTTCSNNIDNMYRAVWSIYFLKLSTERSPHHGLCTSGTGMWCICQMMTQECEQCDHKYSHPAAVMEATAPVFIGVNQPELQENSLHERYILQTSVWFYHHVDRVVYDAVMVWHWEWVFWDIAMLELCENCTCIDAHGWDMCW